MRLYIHVRSANGTACYGQLRVALLRAGSDLSQEGSVSVAKDRIDASYGAIFDVVTAHTDLLVLQYVSFG